MNLHECLPHQLSDPELLVEVKRAAGSEREATAALVALLAEVDARRLYLGAGYPSLFVFCIRSLRLSEHAAYYRIEAARAARRFPSILDRLAEGTLTLTAVRLLAPHLTEANHRPILDEACGLTRREVELLVARSAPRADVPSVVRRLPAPAAPERRPQLLDAQRSAAADFGARSRMREKSEPAPVPVPMPVCVEAPPLLGAPLAENRRPSALVQPLAPARYKVQVTVGADTHAKLRRAQDLMRHANPDGDLAVILDRALTLLVAHLERTRCAATKPKPKPKRDPDRETCADRTAPRGHADRRAIARHGQPRALAASTSVEHDAGGPTTGRAPGDRAPGDELVPARVTERNRANRRGPSRHIPAEVKREVWRRDAGRCTYMGSEGRCGETGGLEYHHVVPHANGGEATISNVRLLCARHNFAEAERFFGDGGPPGT